MASGLETTIIKARNAASRGDFGEAERLYGALLEKFPRNARLRRGLDSLRAIQAAAAPQPAQADIDALIALYKAERHAEAIARGEALIAAFPHSPMLLNVLGAACLGAGDHARAEAVFTQALAIDGNQPSLLANLGTALQMQGRLEEAIEAYRCALALAPDYAEGHYNLGNALRKRGEPAAAVAAYEAALAIEPGHVEALNNLGRALQAQGALDAAIAVYGRAIDIRPDFADALQNLGAALLELASYPAAIEAFRLALAARPANAAAQAQMLHARAQICDFSAFAAFDASPESDAPLPPFPVLAFVDDPARQLRHARHWSQAWDVPAASPAPNPAQAPGSRIRIGYFSADFHDHATLHLMAGLFRAHDRQRFEVIAYSYGPDREDAMRAALVGRVDRFVDLRTMPDARSVALALADGLDIAIDLKGNTQHSRSQLFARRLAPVQINYLGYPGTMGLDVFDYILADPVLIPEAERAFYAEKVLALPGSYQPNDDRRPIARTATARADLGLPKAGFVFCCFNQTYKISPREFGIWMRLLGEVEGSVLWLLRSNAWAEGNLRREAEARGVAPERLVFADRLPNAEHLARLRHADLFLDTFAFNAHTTASDALWAGLPVLTKAGRQFAARVGASLLTAIGLADLIAADDAEYEAKALELARDPLLLAGLRARLATNRATHPLFDTNAYARHLEAAYTAVHQRRLAGLPPDHVTIG